MVAHLLSHLSRSYPSGAVHLSYFSLLLSQGADHGGDTFFSCIGLQPF